KNLASDIDRLRTLARGDPVFDLVARLRGDDEVEPVAARFVSGRRHDLNHIAVLNLVLQRNDLSVDLCAGALIADLRVNRIGEINGRGVARQLDDFPLRREGQDLFREEIELERIQKLARVRNVLLPFRQAPQPLHRVVFAGIFAPALFVFPMRGDALFGYTVHVLGADLNLEMIALLADYRGVQ